MIMSAEYLMPPRHASIEAELEELKSYEDERIAHLVRLCARGFNRSLARRLAQHGITFGQWVYLRILWKREGLTQRQLSEIANLTEPTTHTALTKLERLGIIERKTLAPNRRRQCAFLTQRGRELQEELEPLAIESNDVALVGIPSERREQLREDLITILDNLADDEAEAEAQGLKVPATRSSMFE
jgi:DNA-binding MarR family transcriptional regulator